MPRPRCAGPSRSPPWAAMASALSARATFDPVADTDLWADFAADGRLTTLDRRPARDPAPPAGRGRRRRRDRRRSRPGERRSVRFALAWDLPIVEFGAGRRWWKRYTRDWGRSGTRAWDLARHALAEAPAWRRAIEALAGADPRRPERPDWYKTALFNELYFLVDGGTFWEHGEVGRRRAATADDLGQFALLECLDYPFYDTVDVDFYASFAMLELYPELEMRGHPRPARGDPGRRPGDRRRSRRPARRRRARSAARCPHDVGGPARTRSTGPTATVPGHQRLEGPRAQVRAAGLARRGRRCPRRRRADPRGLAGRRRRPRPARGHATATATACPSTTACPTRPTTPGRCTGRRPTAGRSGWRPSPAAEAMAAPARRRRGRAAAGRAGSSAARSRSTSGCGAATTTPTTTAAGQLGQHHGRPARRPVVRRRDRPRRPGRRRSGSTRRCARSTPTNVARLRRRADGRGQRDAPRRHGRPLERAVGRGLGRDDLCARRVHARARAWPTRAGRRPAGAAAVTYERGLWFRTPEAYDATATSARRSTCGRSRSGRSRRRSGAIGPGARGRLGLRPARSGQASRPPAPRRPPAGLPAARKGRRRARRMSNVRSARRRGRWSR